jgi:hypothetical protein
MAQQRRSRPGLNTMCARVALAGVILAAPILATAGTVCNVDAFAAHQVAVRRGYIFRCVSPDLASATFTYVPGGGLICAAKAMPGLKNRTVQALYFLKEASKPSLKGGWNLGPLEVEGGEFQTSQGNGIPIDNALVAIRFSVRPGTSSTRTLRRLRLFSVGNGLDCSKAIDQAF